MSPSRKVPKVGRSHRNNSIDTIPTIASCSKKVSDLKSHVTESGSASDEDCVIIDAYDPADEVHAIVSSKNASTRVSRSLNAKSAPTSDSLPTNSKDTSSAKATKRRQKKDPISTVTPSSEDTLATEINLSITVNKVEECLLPDPQEPTKVNTTGTERSKSSESLAGTVELPCETTRPKKSLKKKAPKEEVTKPTTDKEEETDGNPVLDFVDGQEISEADAKQCWPYRFAGNGRCPTEEDDPPKAVTHFRSILLDGQRIHLGDCVFVQAPEGIQDFLGSVMEIFTGKDGKTYVRLRWFFRSYDTILEEFGPKYLDNKKCWWSNETNTNPVACINGVAKICRVLPGVKDIPECDYYYDRGYAFITSAFFDIPEDAYAPYPEEAEKNIGKLPIEYHGKKAEPAEPEIHANGHSNGSNKEANEDLQGEKNLKQKMEAAPKRVVLPPQEAAMTMLDMYAGCGAMSTGMEMGSPLAGCTLVSKWAVDFNEAACVSMRYNHPETHVRNESADNFLAMLREWKKLCEKYGRGGEAGIKGKKLKKGFAQKHKKVEKIVAAVVEEASEEEAMAHEDEAAEIEVMEEAMKGPKKTTPAKGRKRDGGSGGQEQKKKSRGEKKGNGIKGEESTKVNGGSKKVKEEYEDGEFEVARIIDVRWFDAENYSGTQFLVRWKGFDPEDDTWEPSENMTSCENLIQEFVIQGMKDKILPLPGDVSVICGGPPCQGASGFNRFRNREDPLACPRNRQLIVYMDIVELLQPRFVLMENVVDMMKFQEGILAKYAIARMVGLNYQSHTGLMVAGSFGVAQFRMRAFFFGAKTGEVLPIFPLPTHLVASMRGNTPVKWQRNLVAWDESSDLTQRLRPALTLGDAISDFPPVENFPGRDEMEHVMPPNNLFQEKMRLPKTTFATGEVLEALKKGNPSLLKTRLHDHVPLKLKDDDLYRAKLIPKRKGANFRDLEGVISYPDKKCGLDTSIPRPMIPGRNKPLCPDYALSFMKGLSFKPFARLWWDQTVPTVITRAEPHNHQILHPEQDRVLTVRENARLQGFPDHYKLFGTVKERYCQVGNAVSVPIAQALGYALGMAALKEVSPGQVFFALPEDFPFHA